MKKNFTALGLMSGTSMDGVDASLIRSDGNSKFTNILDEYCEFDDKLHKKLIYFKNLILTEANLLDFSRELDDLEKEIPLFHVK